MAAFIVFAAQWMIISSGWLASTIRQTIVARVSEGTGRPVALGGVAGDLVRGIELRDLVIAERAGFSRGVTFSADRVRLILDLPHLLLHPGDPLQSIVEADLDAPRFVVARDDQGAWNVQDLFTRERSPLGPRFRGRIVMRGGIVAYGDAFGIPAPPFVTRFVGVDGTLDYRDARQVMLRFSGHSADGEDATVRGRYLPNTGVVDLDLTAHNATVLHWGGYLVRVNELRWVAGRFDGQMHVLGTPSGLALLADYRGTLHLRDAEAEYLPTHLALQHVSGTLGLDTDRASTEDLTLTANGSMLSVRGDIAYPGGGWIDLAVSSPGLDLAAVRALFFPTARTGLTGRASGSVWITGPVEAPYLDGDVTSASGRLNRQAFDAFRARFQYNAGTLTLRGLTAQVGGGQIAGDAVLDFSGAQPTYLFAGTAENLDVGALPAAGLAVTDGLSGRATGRVVGSGTGGRVQLLGGIEMGGGSVQGHTFQHLQALFWDDDGAVDLDFLRAQVGGTTIYASGHIAKSGAPDLSLTALGVPLDRVSALIGLNDSSVGGIADVDGRLGGTSAVPVLSGTVTAWDGHVGQVPFAFARGDLSLSPQGVASRSLVVEDGAAVYQLSGGLRFDPLAAVNLHLDAAEIPAARLMPPAEIPAVTGTLAAHLTLDGPLAHPSGGGRVTLVGGTVSGQRVDRVDMTVAVDGKRVQIESLDAQRDASHLHAAGTVDLGGPLDLSVSVNQIRLAEFSPAMGIDPAPRGTLQFMGAVHGTLRAPEITGTLRVPDLVLGGQAFDASGTITYRPGRLHVDPLTLTQGAGRYSLAGDLYLGRHPSADLALDVTDGQVGTILRAGGLSLPASAEGTINGSIQVTGPLADPSAHLSLTLGDAMVGGMPMGNGVADLTLSHGAIDIQRLELNPGRGQIAARGQVVLDGTSNVEVAAHDLDLNLLRPFFHLDTPLVGTLDFAIQWSGATRNPTAGLSLEAADAGVAGVTADRIVGLAYYKNGTIHIEDVTIAKGQHKLIIQGSLPVAPGGLALDSRGPLLLDVHLEDVDLSLLSLLSRRVHDASGTIQGQVAVRGTVGDPAMSGTVESHGGRLRVDPLVTPIEDLNVDIAFSQDQVLVRDLSASVGGGQVKAGGTVGISDFRPDSVALDLAAHGVTATVPGLYAGRVDADLSLAGGADRPALSGTITLSHGQVALGNALGAAAPANLPIGLDVAVFPSNDVWFDQGPLRAELGGSVHIGGTAAHPKLSGTIRSLQGQIVLLGTPFDLTEGQAVFSEALGYDPQIIARAQRSYGQTRVFIDINAVPPDAPITSWSSEPPMAQSDVQALVFGSSGPNPALGQGLGRAVFGSATTGIRRAFHLDELSLSYEPQNPVTLRIGKFILRNVYLALEEVFARPSGTTLPAPGPGALTPLTTSGQPYTVISLEYLLSPTFSLTYDVDSLGDNGFFLLTRYPF